MNGINLDNYYPNHVSYNSVVYVHKKFLEQPKEKKEKVKKETKEKKVKKKGKKCDKSQQVEDYTLTELNHEMLMNSGLLGHSLQFTRNFVPVVIPPSGIVSPIYYTIKATKKSKSNPKKPKAEISNLTYKKEKSKRVVETYRNEKGSQKESLSVKETISYTSQSDTLDELHINPSLCCTLSDMSDHKQVKKERQRPRDHKLAPSESFEALATEFFNTAGESKIKIHLMNETEKNLLAENIRLPLLKAIRECVLELNNQIQNNQNSEVTTVQKYVKCNTQKLDNVIDKLACIEEKIGRLDKHIVTEDSKAKASKAVKVQVSKGSVSTLEQLGEDLLEIKEDSSGDEYFAKSLSARKKARGKSAVVKLEATDIVERQDGVGAGEQGTEAANADSDKPKLERPNRIPARFCWTDAAKKNAA